ncbi:MAG: two-component system response regulator [Deltaproteobacteria bacterium]|nr:MAG: two-component system response regulator [Deltaproteobacteria bacterium]
MKRPTIMVVDDDRGSLRVLSEILKAAGYDVMAFDSGINALKAIFKSPPDLIILDIVMPGIDGLELCRMLKENPEFSDIPVLFISGVDDVDNKLRAFSVGGADYITKPFHLREIQARVKTHLQLRAAHLELKQYNRELQRMVEEKVKEILESQLSTIVAISKLVEYHDIETGQHIERVQMFCKILALSLKDFSPHGLSVDDEFVETIYWAAALHDIGKVGIPDNILLKPNRLTPSEKEIMKSHTIIGARALEEVQRKYPRNKFLNMGIEIARWHHERWDGKGYPDGLSGEEIPLSARIMALADMYDALRAKRPYKPAFGHAETVEAIKAEEGHALDPTIVEAFLKVEESFSQIWENLTT